MAGRERDGVRRNPEDTRQEQMNERTNPRCHREGARTAWKDHKKNGRKNPSRWEKEKGRPRKNPHICEEGKNGQVGKRRRKNTAECGKTRAECGKTRAKCGKTRAADGKRTGLRG